MNDTNISNWTVDSSHERSSYLRNKLLSPSKPLKPPKSPQRTQTHRSSTSFHDNNINESKEIELNNTNNATINSNDNVSNIEAKISSKGSVSTYTDTYIHPLDRNSDNNNNDIKDEETTCETVSIISSSNNKDNNLLRNSLNDTMDYTKKLMATIQSMEKDCNLKYKVRKYSMKMKRLEIELSDEKKINENKSIFLDKVNNELNKTNIEIERIESE
eukprot:36736_1